MTYSISFVGGGEIRLEEQFLRPSGQAQHMVVVAPPPLVSPQVVVRLQQCSYILVNDCRVNAPVNRSDARGSERALDPRLENGLFWRTVPAQPCVEEGDKGVNSCEFRT